VASGSARTSTGEQRRVSDEIVSKTTIYVAGGTVMAIENLKEGTKDLYVVVESARRLTKTEEGTH